MVSSVRDHIGLRQCERQEAGLSQNIRLRTPAWRAEPVLATLVSRATLSRRPFAPTIFIPSQVRIRTRSDWNSATKASASKSSRPTRSVGSWIEPPKLSLTFLIRMWFRAWAASGGSPVWLREMCEWPLRFRWLGSDPLDGPVNRGSADAEEFGEFGLGVRAEVVQLEQVLGLIRLQLRLLAAQPTLSLRYSHPFSGAQPDQVGFELRHHR